MLSVSGTDTSYIMLCHKVCTLCHKKAPQPHKIHVVPAVPIGLSTLYKAFGPTLDNHAETSEWQRNYAIISH